LKNCRKEKPKEISLEDDGKIVWRIDLKSGEKRESQLKFKIEYPVTSRRSGWIKRFSHGKTRSRNRKEQAKKSCLSSILGFFA